MRLANVFAEISQPTWGHLPEDMPPSINNTVADDLFEEDVEIDRELTSHVDVHNPDCGGKSPLSRLTAKAALADVTAILNPKRKSGLSHNPFEGDELLRKRLGMVKMFLWTYTDKSKPMPWMASSLKAAHAFQMSTHMAKQLRKWARSFIEDCTNLPINLYGSWNVSLLDNGKLAKEIHQHLQEKGKWVKALDIVHFLDTSKIKAKYSLKKTILLATAQRWMFMMDYWWTKMPSGQYVDRHEREDMVTYGQSKFLPTIAKLKWNL